jgi:hypothetical protein
MGKDSKKIRYRVRDMSNNLYQDGAYNKWTGEVSWSKKGKTWTKLSDLQEHFKLLEENNISLSPLWEVIEMISIDVEGERYPASGLATRKR